MEIKEISKYSFRGYDARKLKGFLMSTNEDNLACAMQKIGKKEGFKIYTINEKKIVKGVHKDLSWVSFPWAQDSWTILKNKVLTRHFNQDFNVIKNFFGLGEDFTERVIFNNNLMNYEAKIREKEEILKKAIKAKDYGRIAEYSGKTYDFEKEQMNKDFHIAGGNIFIVKGDNSDELIIGEDALDIVSIDELKGMYEVEKVTVLPKMDFHIDLFIRPLNNKKILLADDDMTLAILKNNLQKIKDYVSNLPYRETKKQYELQRIITSYQKAINSFVEHKSLSKFAQTDEVEAVLKNNGYEVIRVPGRIYKTDYYLDNKQFLRHDCNFMNANVLINDEGELVYITNSSDFDSRIELTPEMIKEIGCGIEDSFINSILPYVKKEHIYFIKSDTDFLESVMLRNYGGGIHCICTEIPIEVGGK